jgi:hypothetical protein
MSWSIRASTATGITSGIAPLIGAALAGLNYNILFIVSALISLLAFAAMRWWVQEPRIVIQKQTNWQVSE